MCCRGCGDATPPRAFRDAVDAIRVAVPGASVTTDIIAGFPGERDADHQDSLQMMEDVRFTDVHVFPYSQRPNTSASLLADDVTPDLKRTRARELRELGALQRRDALNARIGAVETVLFESADSGLTDTYLPVRAAASFDLTNQLRSVRITSADETMLFGELVG